MNVQELRLHDLGFKTPDDLMNRYEELITGLLHIDNTIIKASAAIRKEAETGQNWANVANVSTGFLVGTHTAIVALLHREPA